MTTATAGYLDGAWHRLHPATPLLRGGIWLLALGTYVAVSFRDRLIGLLLQQRDDGGDPIELIQRHHLEGIALGVVAAVLLVLVGAFWVSWRTSEFRVDHEAVQVRHGVLNRTVRTARLDRIQGVTITRPLLARLVGAARIELDVAGQNADVRLEYLTNGSAELLRADVLRLASGAREPADSTADAPVAGGVPLLAVSPLRALGAALLHESTIAFVVVVAVVVVVLGVMLGGPGPAIVAFVPSVLGLVTVTVRRVGRLLRFTVVGTPDGVRVGSGLLSTSTQAVPPGRIHAVRIEQPLVWRPFGWWRVTVNRAAREGRRRREDQERSVAPVASFAEVLALLPYLVPGVRAEQERVVDGLTGSGASGAFTPAPRRARWLRPLAWRRTGFAFAADALLLRGGFLERHLAVVPLARVQSVAVVQGPVERLLGVATVHPHVVSGPAPTRIELVDADRAVQLFGELAEIGRAARAGDRSHRWAERVAVAEGGS